MPNTNLITFTAIVTDILPGGKCRIAFTNGHQAIIDPPIDPPTDQTDTDPPAIGETIAVEVSSHDISSARTFFRRIVRP